MSDFTEFCRDLFARLRVPAKCVDCGNTNLEELSISTRGKVVCRQDEENIRLACKKQPGWLILDAKGNVIDRGPGITLKVTGDYGSS